MLLVLYAAGEEVHAVYKSFPVPVMRADFWRYAILYAFGGIYADIDVEALLPLEDWLPPKAEERFWPPKTNTSASPTWSSCSIVVGLENELHFCQWVRSVWLCCIMVCPVPLHHTPPLALSSADHCQCARSSDTEEST